MKRNEKRDCRWNCFVGAAVVVVVAIVGGLLLGACGTKQQSETYTIGVVNLYPSLEIVIDGFKAEMAELGYVEGENVTYVYNGALESDSADAEIERLLAQDVDLLLSLASHPTLEVKQAVEGTDVPVLFVAVLDPVGEGLVESLGHPGGNLTGIQFTNAFPKALEWLLSAVPETTQVYIPYIPVDATTAPIVETVLEAATALGVETVAEELQSVEEVVAAIETLPEGAAIFSVPSPALISGNYVGVATERGIAIGTIGKNEVEAGALVGYGVDSLSMGKQAAHMADQILQGTAPGDLPVETAEHYLSINLQIAESIGLDIPDDVLRQADFIIR